MRHSAVDANRTEARAAIARTSVSVKSHYFYR